MANIPIWPGSSSFHPGDTPFGFYDYNPDFQKDADKVAKFCALRLGYPIENVELQDINFYAAFEEAVTVYANELFAYKQREDFLTLEGTPYSYENTQVDLQNAIITPNLQRIVDLSEQYGTWAGVGGNVDWYSGSVVLTSSIQDYDLDAWATSQGLTGSDVEIMRIFYQGPPAINEMYTPYAAGFGFDGDAAAFAFMGGGYGFGDNFLMMPLSYDMQTIQAIEMSNDVRLSNYTFQLINNKLRIFPVPTFEDTNENDGYRANIWFRYIEEEARINSAIDSNATGSITNESNVPYNNPNYTQINSIGRSWIFEYTLAIVKETLGYVRGKYATVPIPGAEVTLNQGDLISAATSEKEALLTRLREYFDQTSRQSLLERRSAESTARQSELNQVPMTIFIG